MLKAFLKSRRMRAFGSAMDVYPAGNYLEHMPKGKQSARIAKYWNSTGKYIEVAMDRYEQPQLQR